MSDCSVHNAQGIIIEGIVFEKRDIFLNYIKYTSNIVYFCQEIFINFCVKIDKYLS